MCPRKLARNKEHNVGVWLMFIVYNTGSHELVNTLRTSISDTEKQREKASGRFTEGPHLSGRTGQRAQQSDRVPQQTRWESRTDAEAATRTGPILIVLDTCRDSQNWIFRSAFWSSSEAAGERSFGEIFRGQFNGKPVAVNKLLPGRRSVQEVSNFFREITFLSFLRSHGNLVQLEGFSVDPLSIVMEFVSRGSLHSLLYSRCETLYWRKYLIDESKSESCWVFWTE